MSALGTSEDLTNICNEHAWGSESTRERPTEPLSMVACPAEGACGQGSCDGGQVHLRCCRCGVRGRGRCQAAGQRSAALPARPDPPSPASRGDCPTCSSPHLPHYFLIPLLPAFPCYGPPLNQPSCTSASACTQSWQPCCDLQWLLGLCQTHVCSGFAANHACVRQCDSAGSVGGDSVAA